MFEIFNKPALTRKQRFTKAVIFGLLAALAGLILELVMIHIFYVISSLLYIAIGYGIAYVIKRYGRGVQVQFSILAAGLTAAVIVIADLIAYGSSAIYMLTSFGVSSLFEVGYRLVAIYVAYTNARVV